MSIPLTSLNTREGVLRFPNEAAQALSDTPPESTNPLLTDEVMATRAGVLRFPNEAANFIQDIIDEEEE